MYPHASDGETPWGHSGGGDGEGEISFEIAFHEKGEMNVTGPIYFPNLKV
jgi:hypothetical protein